MLPALAHVDCWIFDLDNTLYPASADLFGLIDARMGQFIQNLLGVDPQEARRIQKSFFVEHGTTLNGLMAAHGIEPRGFLDFVHDIEMDAIAEDRRLVEAVAKLPGRKLVFTNGDTPYATRILDRLGLSESFEAIHDIHAMNLMPKPHASAYAGFCAAFDIDPAQSLFADDMARNLAPAKAIGMTTVWIDNGSEQSPGTERDHIDFTVPVLAPWLENILETS